MLDHDLIEATKNFVKKELAGAEGGHDWFHIERVYKNALLIAKKEEVDKFIISLFILFSGV
jgi:uncharacterized protein